MRVRVRVRVRIRVRVRVRVRARARVRVRATAYLLSAGSARMDLIASASSSTCVHAYSGLAQLPRSVKTNG